MAPSLKPSPRASSKSASPPAAPSPPNTASAKTKRSRQKENDVQNVRRTRPRHFAPRPLRLRSVATQQSNESFSNSPPLRRDTRRIRPASARSLRHRQPLLMHFPCRVRFPRRTASPLDNIQTVISSAAGRRFSFKFAFCERFGLRSEISLFDFHAPMVRDFARHTQLLIFGWHELVHRHSNRVSRPNLDSRHQTSARRGLASCPAFFVLRHAFLLTLSGVGAQLSHAPARPPIPRLWRLPRKIPPEAAQNISS